jgi:hypothetical protein
VPLLKQCLLPIQDKGMQFSQFIADLRWGFHKGASATPYLVSRARFMNVL